MRSGLMTDVDGEPARRQLEDRVRELEARLLRKEGDAAFLESVLRAVPAFVVNLDSNLRIRYLNRYQPGHDEASTKGRHLCDFLSPADRETALREVERARATGKITTYTSHEAAGPNGTTTSYVNYVAPIREPDGRIGVCLAAMDIGEQKAHERALRELEEQLRQSQKMEAIGSLTAGIAHNFNNMLAVILPTLEVATELVPPDRAELLRQASHAASRASELVRQLMTYAGQSRGLRQRVCNLAEIVESAIGICQRTLDPHIQIVLDCDEAARGLNVQGNAVQLEHVVVNLLINARDAIVQAVRLRGLIQVTVRRSSAPLSNRRGVLSEAVCIEVRDNGTGIPEHARARVFEPFFTTKPAGQGTGLGLATSFGTVRDHEGTLLCNDVIGDGAEFRVTLPLSFEPLMPTSLPPPTGDAPLGTRVLLVDDDAAVRGALGHVLTSAGLVVAEAGCGNTALEVLEAGTEVDVILLDRAMPGRPGEQFLPRMRTLAPRARVVFLSGQSIEPRLAKLVDGVIPKPVSSPNLLTTIRQVLQRGH